MTGTPAVLANEIPRRVVVLFPTSMLSSPAGLPGDLHVALRFELYLGQAVQDVELVVASGEQVFAKIALMR